MTPWDLIIWALAAAAAILIIGAATAITWAMLQGARGSRPTGAPIYSSKGRQ